MLVADLGLKGSDFVVLTPYRAGRDQIKLALQDSMLPAECKDVEVHTTDSFQGHEGTIVIFVLTVNADTGPLFVAGMISLFSPQDRSVLTFWTDPHRVCLGTTRHKAALVVVGDIHTVAKTSKPQSTATAGDGGQEISAGMSKSSAFGDMLRWFSSHRRVAMVRPKDMVPAVPPAKAPAWNGGGVNAHSGMNWD